MSKHAGAVLNGLFTLADGISEEEFFPAFEAFYQHLKEMGFVRRYRMMRRQPFEGFGAPLPNFDYHVEIEFPSLDEIRHAMITSKKTKSLFGHYIEP
jgi:uncharacterized protein DUF6614